MGTTIILLLFPVLAFARISVKIEVSTAKNETSVTFDGSDSNIISDIEIASFNITTSNLKAAVSAHAGGDPLDVFVKSPTPWGDLYNTYNWPEVKRNTNVKSVKVANVATETVLLYKEAYNNKLSSEIVCDADVKADVENYVKNNYTGKQLSMAADYNVDLVIGFNLLMPLKLVSNLSSNGFVRNAMKIQTKEKFTLKPSQSAEFILNATKIYMDVLIDYESSLIGDVAANYNPRHNGHHFWAYDVKAIMGSVGSKSAIQKGIDLVTIEFFTDAFGYVIDQDTVKIIIKISADYIF